MSFLRGVFRFAVFAFVTVVLGIQTQAQFKAGIQGTVMDPSGNAVAAAKVIVTNQATGISRETTTSPEGFYRVSELPPGTYTVTVEAGGFKQSVARDIAVEAEQPRGFDVTLTVGNVQESITVTSWIARSPDVATIRTRSIRATAHGTWCVRRQRSPRKWELVRSSAAGRAWRIQQRHLSDRKPSANCFKWPTRDGQQLYVGWREYK